MKPPARKPYNRFLKGTIMNTTKFLAVATLSTLAAFGSVAAHADAVDAPEFAAQFQGQRTRAEVQTEAVAAARTNLQKNEPNGSRVLQVKSTADRAAVRADAAQAVRLGKIGRGEANVL